MKTCIHYQLEKEAQTLNTTSGKQLLMTINIIELNNFTGIQHRSHNECYTYKYRHSLATTINCDDISDFNCLKKKKVTRKI